MTFETALDTVRAIVYIGALLLGVYHAMNGRYDKGIALMVYAVAIRPL